MSVKKRILSALAANSFGQAVTVLSQLVLTPFFIAYWGAGQYGEWLMISAIPAYLIMADMGIGSAAANEMVMCVGNGDKAAARLTFLSMIALLGRISFIVLFLTALMGWWIQIFKLSAIHSISLLDAQSIIVILGLSVCVSFYSSLVSAGYRAVGKNALGIMLANTIRLAEVMLTGVMLWYQCSPLQLCIGTFLMRLIANILLVLHLKYLASWLFYPWHQYDKTLLKRLIKPSIAFLALPLGNALALQAPILIIGSILGGEMVAIFSTMRTLSRLPLQITNALNTSVWPELSLAYGAGNFELLRKIHQKSWRVTVLFISFIAMVLALTGKLITQLWLGSDRLFNEPILYGLLICSVISAVWNLSNVMLVAVNAHLRVGVYYVAVNALSVILMGLFSVHHGTWYLANLIVTEILLTILVLPMALKISQDNFIDFFLYVTNLSKYPLLSKFGKKKEIMN